MAPQFIKPEYRTETCCGLIRDIEISLNTLNWQFADVGGKPGCRRSRKGIHNRFPQPTLWSAKIVSSLEWKLQPGTDRVAIAQWQTKRLPARYSILWGAAARFACTPDRLCDSHQPGLRMNNAGICALGLPAAGSSCFFTGTAGALILGT